IAGIRIADGSTVAVSMKGEQLSYQADGNVADANPQHLGETFKIPVLADERLAGTINGHVIASGTGTTIDALKLDATGELKDSTVAGGTTPRLTFTMGVGDAAARVVMDGSVANLDPAVAAGKPAAQGSVGGTFDVDANIASLSKGITKDSVSATA